MKNLQAAQPHGCMWTPRDMGGSWPCLQPGTQRPGGAAVQHACTPSPGLLTPGQAPAPLECRVKANETNRRFGHRDRWHPGGGSVSVLAGHNSAGRPSHEHGCRRVPLPCLSSRQAGGWRPGAQVPQALGRRDQWRVRGA